MTNRVRQVLGLLGAATLFTALAIIYSWPLALHIAHRLDRFGDPQLNAWIISWNLHAFFTSGVSLWDANIFYPHLNTLTYSENLLFPSALMIPVRLLTDNPVLIYNIAWLAGMVLTALGAFALARYLTHSTLAGIIAGIIYACCPFRITMAAQIQSQYTLWCPLAVLFTLIYFDQSDRAMRRCFALLAGAVCLAAQFLSNMYAFMFVSVTLPLVQGIRLVSTPHRRRALIELAAFWIVVGLLLIPVLFPYLRFREEMHFERTEREAILYSARVASFFAWNSRNLWFGRTATLPDNGLALSPGLIAALLAVVPFFLRRRSPTPRDWTSPTVIFAAMTFFGTVLALGPRITFFDHHVGPGPYDLLYRFVPGFDDLRVPARFVAIMMLGIAMLAAMNTRRLLATIRSPVVRACAGCALIALVAIEYINRPNTLKYRYEPAEEYEWLKDAPPGAVLEWPIPRHEIDRWSEASRVLHSTTHWKPLFNGYSGFTPPQHAAMIDELAGWPDDRALRAITQLKIAYVVGHKLDNAKKAECEARMNKLADFGRTCIFAPRPAQ